MSTNVYKSPSFWASILIAIVYIWVPFNLELWKTKRVIYSDVNYYYEYLPAIFIHNDWRFSHLNQPGNNPDEKIWIDNDTITGGVRIKTTMGLAIMYTPFFLTAYAIDSINPIGHISGYGVLYEKALAMAALSYALAALVLLRQLLRRYFTDWATTMALLVIFLASNLAYYVCVSPGMSHVYTFFLVLLWVNCSINFLDRPNLKNAILIGLIFGLLVLIRPINGLLVLFPLLFGIQNWQDVKSRFILYLTNWPLILVITVFAFFVFTPQLFFWKINSDTWFLYTYGNERFFLAQPNILKGFFSFRNGLLIYSPMLIMAIPGVYFLIQQKNKFGLTILILVSVYAYFIYSWWAWWYGGSYGSRAMIDVYLFWTIGLAATFQTILHRWPKQIKILLLIVFVFSLLNGLQIYQRRYGVIHYDSMTAEAYVSSFGRLKPDPNFYKLIKHPNYDAVRDGFTSSDKLVCYKVPPIMDKSEEFLLLKELTKADLRVFNSNSIFVELTYFKNFSSSEKSFLVARIDDRSGAYTLNYSQHDLSDNKWQKNAWCTEEIEIAISKMNDTDVLKVYVWNPNQCKIKLKDFSVANY